MSRTKRIYNTNTPGIPFTRRAWICMGRCKLCRDYNKEPRTIRKRLKAQFRHELPDELEVNKL